MYKFANEEETKVNNLETGHQGIHKGVWLWRQYQEWVEAGGITEPYKTQAELDVENEELARQEAEESRLENIDQGREAAGMKSMSVEQAEAWITAQFTGVETIEDLVAANIKVWKKAVPYLLPKN